MGKKYAGSARVGEKGQIVIPKEVRDMFGIKPGDTLLVLADSERGAAIVPSGSIMDVTDRILSPDKGGKEEEK